MVIKLPRNVRLTTDAEAAALEARRQAVQFKPSAGFLLDTVLTRLPQPAYGPTPGMKSYKRKA